MMFKFTISGEFPTDFLMASKLGGYLRLGILHSSMNRIQFKLFDDMIFSFRLMIESVLYRNGSLMIVLMATSMPNTTLKVKPKSTVEFLGENGRK